MCNIKDSNGAKRINLLEYLSLENFEIPIYQRNFVWKQKQTIDFLKELYFLYSSIYPKDKKNIPKQQKMFIGSIYISDISNNLNVSKWELIDGQQRTVLFHFLKDFFLKESNEYSFFALDNKYNEFINNGETERKYDSDLKEEIIEIKRLFEHFKISSVNKYFEQGIDNLKSNYHKILNEVTLSLNKNFNTLYCNGNFYIDEECDHYELDYQKILEIYKFIKFLFNNISLILIETNEDESINEVFRSINSKGKDLNQWELIRNEIYRNLLSNKITYSSATRQLKKIDKNLKKISETWFIKQEEFIWAYLIFKINKYVSKKDLATEFSKLLKNEEIENKKSSILIENKLIDLLITDIEKFKENLSIDSPVANKIKWFLYICNEIKAIQIKIITLSVFMSTDFCKYGKWIEKFLVNYIVFININEGRSNSFEKFFMSTTLNTIERFNENDDIDIKTLIEEADFYKVNKKIIDNISGEKIIDNIFCEKIENTKEFIKVYIFLATPPSIEDIMLPKLKYEYEHVLPQNPVKWKKEYEYWSNFTTDEIKVYVKKIGNVILLNKEKNKRANNNILSLKLEEYYKDNENSKERQIILCNGIYLDKGVYHYLRPIFNDFQENGGKPTIEPRFDNILINERTINVAKVFINLLKDKL